MLRGVDHAVNDLFGCCTLNKALLVSLALSIPALAFDDEPLEIIVSDSRRDSNLNVTDAFL